MQTTVTVHTPQSVLRLPSFELAARRRRARLTAAPASRRRIASADHRRHLAPEGRRTTDTRFTIPLLPPLYLD